MILNEWDVSEAADVLTAGLGEDHHASRHARFLKGYVDAVNGKSDGWAYWTKGRSPANRMCALVRDARDSLTGSVTMPSEQEFRKALTPMRTAAGKLGMTLPDLDAPAAAAPTPGR